MFEALNGTGMMVAVIVRLPDAPVKRPVSTADLIVHDKGGFSCGGIDTTRPIHDRDN